MATHSIGSASAIVIPFPGKFPRYIDPTDAAALSIIRNSLRGAIDELVSLLDQLEGDADAEANGEETDNNHSEDDALDYERFGNGPGCVYSDPDAEHDGREQESGQ